MDNIIMWIKWAVTLLGGAITTLLGGWDVALKILVLFAVVDFCTGWIAAITEGTKNGEGGLNSEVGYPSIARKVLIFVPVALGYWLDVLMGQEVLRSLAIFFYIANEGLSITENIGRAGVPIPAPLYNALEQLRKQGDGVDGN